MCTSHSSRFLFWCIKLESEKTQDDKQRDILKFYDDVETANDFNEWITNHFVSQLHSNFLLSKKKKQNKNKFTAAILLTIVSCDKIINHKSLGDIWHIAGYEFRELHHTAKQNSFYSSAYL